MGVGYSVFYLTSWSCIYRGDTWVLCLTSFTHPRCDDALPPALRFGDQRGAQGDWPGGEVWRGARLEQLLVRTRRRREALGAESEHQPAFVLPGVGAGRALT